MVVANIARKNGPFTGDGIATVFPYSFRILTAAEISVYQNDTQLTSAQFSVSGVDSEDGGNVTFNAAPAISDTIWIFGETTKQQPTSYPEQGPFPAVSHETGLDRSIMVLWELEEVQERIPTFKPSTLSALRNMELPQPLALNLLGWNADGDGMTNFSSTILTVTPLPGAGARTEAQASVELSPVGDELVLTATALVPAGALLTAVLAYNDVALGNSNGLTGYSLGTVSAPQRFGRGLALTQGSASNAGQWRNYVQEPAVDALNVVVSAEGGKFDSDGTIIVTAVFEIYTAPTAVP